MNTIKSAGFRAIACRSVTVALLAFCSLNSATAQETPQAPVATTGAATETASGTTRVRLFGQNGALVAFYQNSTCIGGNGPKTTVSGGMGGMGDAFSSFLGSAKNTSIGMTESPTTSGLAKRDGIMSKAYFREYEISGNQPLTVQMHFQSAARAPRSKYCPVFGGTFTPEAGKEYEVTLDVHPGQCTAVVREIQKNEQGPATLRDLAIAPTQKCT